MKGIVYTLEALHDGECALAGQWAEAAARHSAEHEVRHVAQILLGWSNEHGRRLADAGARYGLALDPPPEPGPRGLPPADEEGTLAEEHPAEEGLLLLLDLRELHLGACGNSLLWEMLGQVAQASGESSLLDLATSCHPRTLRQMRWTNTMLKSLSPQVLTSL
ncbi:hypothetical protein [Streptomyces sp. NPDC057682]|uniref:hypothetical protein n=1 Tax=Streptomyces sp. NPDC057682 TaxID=3346210 RepID=UPI0036982D08